MSFQGPVLGLDLGSRRIGLAVSDPEGGFAFPAGSLVSRGIERDLQALRALVEEREVVRIVVGLPLHMDGHAGPEAEAARAFARRLGEATGLPVEMLDERWTTVEAERPLQELRSGTRRRGSRRSQDVDSAAATILLRTYLERESRREGAS
jgi:putative Holliday junction resolvase